MDLAEKQLIALLTMVSVGWFASSALRAEDLDGIVDLFIALGTILAIGIIIESRTGTTTSIRSAESSSSRSRHVPTPDTALNGVANGADQVSVTGPTRPRACGGSMLAMTMPFALVRVFDRPPGKSRWLNAAAVGLMVAAAIATQEKTSFVSLLVVFVFVAVYRPRRR